MSKSRFLIGILSTVFVLTIASSARADMAHVNMFLEKQIFAERHDLTGCNVKDSDTGYLYAAHFENNNGKHLGFSVIAHRTGPGLIGGKTAPSVSQNPEPTAMVLLGTGLAASAAIARRKNRKRSK